MSNPQKQQEEGLLSQDRSSCQVPYERYPEFDRVRDDVIHAELRHVIQKPLKLDEDLPGMGQFYCLHCDRYFGSAAIRDDHNKTKLHKKRVKAMQGSAPHTQVDAEVAAGMGRPDNGPKLREDSVVIPMVEWPDLVIAS